VQLLRQLAVRSLVDHVRGHQPPLVGRQLGQHGARGVLAQHADHLRVRLGDRPALHLERAAHPLLDVAAAVEVREPARGDREQPGRRRRSARPEASPRDQRGRERLGGEVGRLLGVEGAAGEVAEQRLDVAVVEHPEGLGVV
jgi:hypothetical protein